MRMKPNPDYLPFLCATALAPIGLCLPDASQMLPCTVVFIVCGPIFLLRYFQCLRMNKQRMIKFVAPFVSIAILESIIFLPAIIGNEGAGQEDYFSHVYGVCLALSIFFIWGMFISEIARRYVLDPKSDRK